MNYRSTCKECGQTLENDDPQSHASAWKDHQETHRPTEPRSEFAPAQPELKIGRHEKVAPEQPEKKAEKDHHHKGKKK